MKVNLNASVSTHTPQKKLSALKLMINGVEITQVKEFNFLGVVMNEHLNC